MTVSIAEPTERVPDQLVDFPLIGAAMIHHGTAALLVGLGGGDRIGILLVEPARAPETHARGLVYPIAPDAARLFAARLIEGADAVEAAAREAADTLLARAAAPR